MTITTTNLPGMENRWQYVGGIADLSTQASYAKGTKVTAATITAATTTFTEVISAAQAAAGVIEYEIFNITDQWMEISFNTTVAHRLVPPGYIGVISLKDKGRFDTGGLFVRRESTNPTAGGFFTANALL